MLRFTRKTFLYMLLAFLGVWAGLKYLLPLAVPFLLGTGLALAAEPAVKLLSRRLSRGVSAALGVTAALLLLTCVTALLGAVLVKELGLLAGALPDLSRTAQGGLQSLEGFLLELADSAPEGVRPLLSRTVTGAFQDGSVLFDRLSDRLPSMASAVLGWLPGSALTLGTGILSAFMVSARLPVLALWVRNRLQTGPIGRALPVLRRIRSAIGGWVKAQLKLAGLCFAIVCAGFLLLRIPYAPIWAALTALVDAIPILGTGTVLLPWALICFLQGETVRALGLLGTYAVAMLSRSILEPRLIGKQLGLDPLVTLAALYTGFRVWGIAGMLLSPVICVAVLEAGRASQTEA